MNDISDIVKELETLDNVSKNLNDPTMEFFKTKISPTLKKLQTLSGKIEAIQKGDLNNASLHSVHKEHKKLLKQLKEYQVRLTRIQDIASRKSK